MAITRNDCKPMLLLLLLLYVVDSTLWLSLCCVNNRSRIVERARTLLCSQLSTRKYFRLKVLPKQSSTVSCVLCVLCVFSLSQNFPKHQFISQSCYRVIQNLYFRFNVRVSCLFDCVYRVYCVLQVHRTVKFSTASSQIPMRHEAISIQ